MPELNDSVSSSEEEELEEAEEEQSDADSDDDSEVEEKDSDDEKSDNEDTNQPSSVVHRNIYVQFPKKRPDDAEPELLKVSNKIKYIRFPRQKKARFCYVHCANEEDAIEVEKLLRTTEVCGLKLFVNRKRKIDDPEFRQKLKTKQIEKKIAKRDAKRLKQQLKKKAKSGKKGAKVNKIVVSSIPDSVTQEKLKEIFSTSVDFQYREKPNKCAFVTFSTTDEATKFIKKHPKVGDKELAVRPMMTVGRKKKQFKGKKEKKAAETSVKEVIEKTVEEPKITPEKKKKTPKKGKETPKAKFSMKAKDKFAKKGKGTKKGAKINYVALKKPLE